MAIKIVKDGFRKGYYSVYRTSKSSVELLANFKKKTDASIFVKRAKQGYYKNAGWTNVVTK